MKNNRKHLRIPLQLSVNIEMSDGRKHIGLTKDISYGGISLQLPENQNVSIGTDCNLSILLEDQDNLEINFESRIIYASETETGIQFIIINGLECYDHFKNLMDINSYRKTVKQTSNRVNESTF